MGKVSILRDKRKALDKNRLHTKDDLIIAAARLQGRLPSPPGVESFGDGHFIGVWEYGDNGNVEPWAVLRATPHSQLMGRRLAINPQTGDIFVGGDGIVQVFNLPEIFETAE